MKTLSRNAKVHAEQSVYTFACEVVRRYPDFIPFGYWELYETMAHSLPHLLIDDARPYGVFATFSHLKGSKAHILGLRLVPDDCTIDQSIVAAYVEEAVPKTVADLGALLVHGRLNLSPFIRAAQKQLSRASLIYQAILHVDGVNMVVPKTTSPVKRNVHVAIDADFVAECIQTAMPNEVKSVLQAMIQTPTR